MPGFLLTAGALATHIATVKRLNRGEPFVGRPTWLGVATAALILLAGVLLIAYLLVST